MRLLNTTTLQLEQFHGEPPSYAVLSHRWEKDEITFQDMLTPDKIHQRQGCAKLMNSVDLANCRGFSHIWIDACCIDKSSSAELSEAINSMYQWYHGASECLAYLSDVSGIEDLPSSEWFRRGWTLQELIASRNVQFYNATWEPLGDKVTLGNLLHRITGVSEDVLSGAADLDTVPACNKMAWAAHRSTTRPEDVAYCLMGLFNVNMPLLYGEGAEKAFKRLQEEFIRSSDDESIYAWLASPEEVADKPYWALLAPSPKYFSRSGSYTLPRYKVSRHGNPTEITNQGLRTSLTLQRMNHDESGSMFLAALNCCQRKQGAATQLLTITLQKLSDIEDQYARVRPDVVISSGDHIKFFDIQLSYSFHSDTAISTQVFVRSKPRVSDDVAGFCVPGGQNIPFSFTVGSPKGPVGIPAHIVVNLANIRNKDAAGCESWPLRVLVSADTSYHGYKHSMGSVESGYSVTRQVLEPVKLEFISKLDDGRQPPSDRIVPAASYRDPYLVVGFEQLPQNMFGTPPGYKRPWYTFIYGHDHGPTLARLKSGQEELVTSHVAPGGSRVCATFSPATYDFRTHYEVRFTDSP